MNGAVILWRLLFLLHDQQPYCTFEILFFRSHWHQPIAHHHSCNDEERTIISSSAASGATFKEFGKGKIIHANSDKKTAVALFSPQKGDGEPYFGYAPDRRNVKAALNSSFSKHFFVDSCWQINCWNRIPRAQCGHSVFCPEPSGYLSISIRIGSCVCN